MSTSQFVYLAVLPVAAHAPKDDRIPLARERGLQVVELERDDIAEGVQPGWYVGEHGTSTYWGHAEGEAYYDSPEEAAESITPDDIV